MAKALEIKAKGYKQCDHKLFEYQKYKYRKSLIRSRPLIQVYSIRSRTIQTYATSTYHCNCTFWAFLGSFGGPFSPLEKSFAVKFMVFELPLMQV